MEKKILLPLVNMGALGIKMILKKEFLVKDILNMDTCKKAKKLLATKLETSKLLRQKLKMAVLIMCLLGLLGYTSKVTASEKVREVKAEEHQFKETDFYGIAGTQVREASSYEEEVRRYNDPKILNLNKNDVKKDVRKYKNHAREKVSKYAKEAYELKRKSFKQASSCASQEKLFRGAVGMNGDSEPLEFSDKCRKLVFVSLALSENNLEDIIRQAKVRGWVPVLRGFKEGSYKKTAKYLEELVRRTGYGVVIDPESFKEFDVRVVPTFVVAGVKDEGCDDNGKSSSNKGKGCKSSYYNKIAGNISFEYVESVFNKSGDEVCKR